jgi:hypothetical protein
VEKARSQVIGRVLGGTDKVSGPVEDDKSRQEEWQKLIEKNRKLREAFEVLQSRQASFEGSRRQGCSDRFPRPRSRRCSGG